MRALLARATLIAAAAAIPSGQAIPPGAPTPSPQELAMRIQSHYDTVKDFQSDFTQVYKGGFTKPQPPQHGQVRIKKPGHMRWDYATSPKLVMWADGVRLFTYTPSTRVCEQGPIPTGADAPPSILFFLDRGNLVRDFNASLTADQPPGEWRLTLTPKRIDPDVKMMVLIVDRATLKLSGLEITDAQGARNTLTFTTLKENVGLTDKDLDYKCPIGATMISR